MPSETKADYDDFAPQYDAAVNLPCCQLEAELVRKALGDCTGKTVLDLGGGSGIHARRAIEAGAVFVDVFDISAEMLRVGAEYEAKLGRNDQIRWFHADATKPLVEQVESGVVPSKGYDVVMANWTIDNATSEPDLRGMWRNAISYLKPGGLFFGTRLQNIRASYMSYGKYGNQFVRFTDIPGGQRYTVECLTKPPFGWECVAMDCVYPLSNNIPKEFGLVNFHVLDPAEATVVKQDKAFWDDFLQDPFFVLVIAQNKM